MKNLIKNDNSRNDVQRIIKNDKQQKFYRTKKIIQKNKNLIDKSLSINNPFYTLRKRDFSNATMNSISQAKQKNKLNDLSLYSYNALYKSSNSNLNKFNTKLKLSKNCASSNNLICNCGGNNHSLFISGQTDSPRDISIKKNNKSIKNILKNINIHEKNSKTILYKRRGNNISKNFETINYSFNNIKNNFNDYKLNSITFRVSGNKAQEINYNASRDISSTTNTLDYLNDSKTYNSKGIYNYLIYRNGSCERRLQTEDYDNFNPVRFQKNDNLFKSKLKKNATKEKNYRILSVYNSINGENFFFNPLKGKNNIKNKIPLYIYEANKLQDKKSLNLSKKQNFINSESNHGIKITNESKNNISNTKVINRKNRKRNDLQLIDDINRERSVIIPVKNYSIQIDDKKIENKNLIINKKDLNNSVNLKNNKMDYRIIKKGIKDKYDKNEIQNKDDKIQINNNEKLKLKHENINNDETNLDINDNKELERIHQNFKVFGIKEENNIEEKQLEEEEEENIIIKNDDNNIENNNIVNRYEDKKNEVKNIDNFSIIKNVNLEKNIIFENKENDNINKIENNSLKKNEEDKNKKINNKEEINEQIPKKNIKKKSKLKKIKKIKKEKINQKNEENNIKEIKDEKNEKIESKVKVNNNILIEGSENDKNIINIKGKEEKEKRQKKIIKKNSTKNESVISKTLKNPKFIRKQNTKDTILTKKSNTSSLQKKKLLKLQVKCKNNKNNQSLNENTIKSEQIVNNSKEYELNYTSSSNLNEDTKKETTNTNTSIETDTKYLFSEEDKQNNTNSLKENIKKDDFIFLNSNGNSIEYKNNIDSIQLEEEYKPYVSKYPKKVFKKRGKAYNFKENVKKENINIEINNSNKNEISENNFVNETIKNIRNDIKYSYYFGDSNNNAYFERVSVKNNNININEIDEKLIKNNLNLTNKGNYTIFGVQSEALYIPKNN